MAQTHVVHEASLRHTPETIKRWIGEDNRGVGIIGIRWLRATSSLVIHVKELMDVGHLCMGRRLLRTICYDWHH